jgi:hypothetical protein
MQWKWTIQSQGPDEPVFVIEAEGMGRFIARIDEELKTRAEVMECGFILAAAPDLFVQAVRFSECLESMLRGKFAPSRKDLGDLARDARAAIAKAEGKPCDHNEMVENNEHGYACKCTKCGHIYGKDGPD